MQWKAGDKSGSANVPAGGSKSVTFIAPAGAKVTSRAVITYHGKVISSTPWK